MASTAVNLLHENGTFNTTSAGGTSIHRAGAYELFNITNLLSRKRVQVDLVGSHVLHGLDVTQYLAPAVKVQHLETRWGRDGGQAKQPTKWCLVELTKECKGRSKFGLLPRPSLRTLFVVSL